MKKGTNVWTEDHILVDFDRKPISKTQTMKEAAASVLLQVFDDDDEEDSTPQMMLVAPTSNVEEGERKNEYKWWCVFIVCLTFF